MSPVRFGYGAADGSTWWTTTVATREEAVALTRAGWRFVERTDAGFTLWKRTRDDRSPTP